MTEPKRILVVDDEPRIVELIRLLLDKHGYATDRAYSVDEGLAAFQAGSFRLVITGLVMPGRNGVDFLRCVRKEDASIPFILCTGSRQITREQALNLGFSGFIRKPFKLVAFLHAVCQALAPKTVCTEAIAPFRNEAT